MQTCRAVPIKIVLSDAAKAGVKGVPPKVQLLRTGTFFDERYGQIDITKATLLSIKTNFDAKIRGVDPAIDYKHDSDDIAAAWIKGIELTEDGEELWADVEWTPNGQRVLADKEFRYLSADFSFDYEDNETLQKYGPTLLGAGLTNRPVIKRMKPAIELQERKEPKDMKKTVEQLQAELDAEKAKAVKLADENAALKKAQEDAADGGADDANEDEMGKLKKQLADMQAKLADSEKKCADYEAKLGAADQAKKLAEKTAAFDKLLSAGKVVEAQREAYMAGDAVKMAELGGQVKLGEVGSGNPGAPTPTGETAEAKILKLAEEKVSKDKKLSLGKAIQQARAENPALVAEINKAAKK